MIDYRTATAAEIVAKAKADAFAYVGKLAEKFENLNYFSFLAGSLEAMIGHLVSERDLLRIEVARLDVNAPLPADLVKAFLRKPVLDFEAGKITLDHSAVPSEIPRTIFRGVDIEIVDRSPAGPMTRVCSQPTFRDLLGGNNEFRND